VIQRQHDMVVVKKGQEGGELERSEPEVVYTRKLQNENNGNEICKFNRSGKGS